ncbi:MAG: GMC oxidoreductase [Hyphomonas sp.]
MSAELDRALKAGEAEAGARAFDAIIVGGGAAGGLAASLLCEAGLDVLVLDAGYDAPFWRKPFSQTTNALIRTVADPRLMNFIPPRLINAGRRALRLAGRIRQPVQTQCFAWEQLPDAFVDDRDFPYETPQGRPFNWIRAHRLGGRMIIPGHGRQYYRLGQSDLDRSDTEHPAWPVSGSELDPWYTMVEQRLGLAGARDGLESPPDSAISQPLSLTPDEAALADAISSRWPGASPIVSRYAPPLDTLGAAAATGRLWCRSGAVVRTVTKDETGRASGVEWYDLAARRERTARAPIVFLCASTLESTRILMQSEGIAEKPGILGHNLMDHMMVKAEGIGPKLSGDATEVEPGRCLYIPRFDLCFGRQVNDCGFGVQLYRSSAGERSWFTAVAFCETAPRTDNRVALDMSRRDASGNPVLKIDFQYNEAEKALAGHMSAALEELAGIAGVSLHSLEKVPAVPGTSVHECGTARMGAEAATSVVDSHNECWDAPGLYLTDGAAFPSQGAQNPTLTIMALTARACAHARR